MRSVERVVLGPEIVSQTIETLQSFGRHGCEGFALWVGRLEGMTAAVSELLVPTQRSLKSEDGVGYFLESDTLFEVNKYLAQMKLRLIAQVHSHPTDAYHSETDDRYAIATAEGSFSLVVPDFGFCAADPAQWAVYRLQRGCWVEMHAAGVRAAFIAQKKTSR